MSLFLARSRVPDLTWVVVERFTTWVLVKRVSFRLAVGEEILPLESTARRVENIVVDRCF
jgi:hypothetical protein